MPNPSGRDRRAEARNIEAHESILAQSSTSTQYPNPRSPYPPPHLEKATLLDWNREDSLKLDLWEWHCQLEFEVAGGLQ